MNDQPLDLSAALHHSALALAQCRALLIALEGELLPMTSLPGRSLQAIDQISQRMDGLSDWLAVLGTVAPPGIGHDRLPALLKNLPLEELRHQLTGIFPAQPPATMIEVF